MKTTDYSKIATNYDNEDYRWKIGIDLDLENAISKTKENIQIIDLACGTGNYIMKQKSYFSDQKIIWYGLDNSIEMLKIAKEKIPDVSLIESSVDNIPFEKNSFNFVTSRSSFHHFPDKPKTISEMVRITKPEGMIKIVSISPEYMDCSWVYHYFPETEIEDQKRFWTHKSIFREFELNGITPEITIDYSYFRIKLSDIFLEASNRDMSQFHLISDSEYNRGINRIKKQLDSEPNGEYITNLARMNIKATKPPQNCA